MTIGQVKDEMCQGLTVCYMLQTQHHLLDDAFSAFSLRKVKRSRALIQGLIRCKILISFSTELS